MKRFTILLTALLSVLVFSALFQVWSDAKAEEKEASAPIVYDSTGAMLEAISPNRNVTFSPVYDATGAMLEAINPKQADSNAPIVYDATGAMLEAIRP